MMNRTNLEDKIEGDDNFQAWKYRTSLILEANDLDKYVTGEVPEPEGMMLEKITRRTQSKPKGSLHTPSKIIASLMYLH